MCRLTARQRAVVEAYVATGTVAGAAYIVGIAPKTAEHHLARARRRYQVETTTQLVFRATVVGEIGRVHRLTSQPLDPGAD